MEPKTNFEDSTNKAAAIYTKKLLFFYDYLVLGFSNQFIWRCPSKFLLASYNQHISARHLDVGVGTGYFLDKCKFPVTHPIIHILDLNPVCLATTAKRISRYHPQQHLANILQPLTLALPKFDSIGINYLLHCLPGTMLDKEIVFKNLVPLLNPNGLIFGATILGKHNQQNFLAKNLMHFYNNKGIFNNTEDDKVSLEQILKRNLKKFEIKEIGCVALFHGHAD